MQAFSVRTRMRVESSQAKRKRKTSIPEGANLITAAIQVAANLFQFFILPLILLPKDPRWGFAVLPLALFTNPFWALVHEAIHGVFHSSERFNRAAGRILSILFGAPFHILRLTHLSHHKFNRSPLERGTEIYDPHETSRFRAAAFYYLYIVCGLYLLEVASAWIFFLPKKRFDAIGERLVSAGNSQERWLASRFIEPENRREIRVDSLAILLILGLSAYCYGAHWVILAVMLGLRTFLISFMDNVYHYDTAVNVTVSAHNLRLPRVLSRALLHFNLHRIHHTHPNVPWNRLPEMFERGKEFYDRSLWEAAINQFAGPISVEESLRRRLLRARDLPRRSMPVIRPAAP